MNATVPKIGSGERQPARRRWVLLMPNIPTSPTSARVRIWRRLQSVGAVALKNSVYVLPNLEECVETFQWVAREVADLGGQASLCEGQFVDDLTDREIERRFVEARAADYAEVTGEARHVAKLLGSRRVSPARLAAADEQWSRLQKRLDEIVAIDFCQAPGREAAAGILGAVGRALSERRGGRAAPESRPLAPAERPRAATWVTRTGVHVDRITSAWLIRRFIDPEARFKFVPGKGYVPEPGEIRFDMYDAEFTHVGDRCTFEVLVVRMQLRDPALAAIGELVHDIDLRDGKFAREETAGFKSVITGLCARTADDVDRIAAATPTLEALYTFFGLKRDDARPASASRQGRTRK